MKNLKIVLASCVMSLSALSYAGGMNDDPIVTKVMGEIETRSTDGANPTAWNIEAWAGRDLNKLWIKSSGEKVAGKTESSSLQVLHSKAIAPFWDLQMGLARDFKPSDETRDWLVVGVKGVAPYLFEIDTNLMVGEKGRASLNFDAEYEYMFSQRLILAPEVGISYFVKDDELAGTGKGFSNIEAGLRLRYEISREFAPYIGVNWEKKLGNTADFARLEGEDIEDAQIVVGVRFWF